jgi:surface polysaccharide O-acyltransferase-like enzyme
MPLKITPSRSQASGWNKTTLVNDKKMDTAPLVTAGAGGIAQAKPRLAFIDNLRWVMIVLVVSMHAAVTYSHLGSWYFMEDPKPGPLVLLFFAAYQSFLQAFFMGLLFLIAGYFVPAAFDRKGPGHFLRDRAVRLGIPSLVYMVAIQPVIVLFRDKFNSQGKFARWLSGNCFALYVFHPPVLITVTLALRGFDAPKLVKFLWATGLAVAATCLASSLALRRIPLLKRVL